MLSHGNSPPHRDAASASLPENLAVKNETDLEVEAGALRQSTLCPDDPTKQLEMPLPQVGAGKEDSDEPFLFTDRFTI